MKQYFFTITKQYFLLVQLVLCLLISVSNAYGGGVRAIDYETPVNGRLSAESKLYQSNTLQKFDVSVLNLKNSNTSNNSVANVNTAISITLANFNTISATGNSWLLYQNENASFSMNIGTANNASPQTWALPANFLSYFDGAGRSDFIAPSSISPALQIAGADKVTRTLYFDNTGRPMKKYDHYYYDTNVGTIMNHLGTSYDLEVGDDDNFNEPDYELTSIPLGLGNNFSSTVENADYVTNLTLTKFIATTNVDAFGTISTPTGTYNCLRISVSRQRFTRPNESTAYTLAATDNYIQFMTAEGELFVGKISATSGTVTVSNIQYRRVVATSLLGENNDVKLNNDSKGITINVDNVTAHPSAILDVKSDSLGILIPRIAKANRPHSPATGLLVYQIDNTPGFYYFDGTGWRVLGSSPSARVAFDSAQATDTSEAVAERSPSTVAERSRSQRGQLINGSTFIKFDNPVEDFENIIIQIQAEGDCNGVYISRKTAEGFEVKELQKGKSNVKFTWKLN